MGVTGRKGDASTFGFPLFLQDGLLNFLLLVPLLLMVLHFCCNCLHLVMLVLFVCSVVGCDNVAYCLIPAVPVKTRVSCVSMFRLLQRLLPVPHPAVVRVLVKYDNISC